MVQRQKQHTQKLKGKCSDLLVTKDKVGLVVSGATTDILSDCLETLRVTDADSVEIEDILWLKLAADSWDATKIKKRTSIRFPKKGAKNTALHSCNTFWYRMQTLIYAIHYCSKF